MKKYYIDVIYTTKVSVEVEAENETQAKREAYYKAGKAMPDEIECIDQEANILNVEDC